MNFSDRNEKKNFIFECIANYHDQFTLCYIKYIEYMYRTKKNYVYNVSMKKYQKHFQTATSDDVRKNLIFFYQITWQEQ